MYSKIYGSMVLARRESRLSRDESLVSSLVSATRGGNLLLSGTVVINEWIKIGRVIDHCFSLKRVRTKIILENQNPACFPANKLHHRKEDCLT